VTGAVEVRGDARAGSLARPQLLLLDAGNTLVFLDHAAVAQAAATVSVQVSAEALERGEPTAKRRYEQALRQGVSHEDGWQLYMRSIYEAAGVSAEQAVQATKGAQTEHERFNLWRKVPPDLKPALDRALAGGIRLGVVSNSEGKLDALFERVGLHGYFEHVVDSALEGVRKPDPEIFHRALRRFGVPASAALYAGDIPQVDVDGARGAGLDGVLIDPFDHYADYREARRFDSVAALIDTLLG
jgi:HAD superfamily hydrolase (TIGR01509 family)